jgi:hypothetical protein
MVNDPTREQEEIGGRDPMGDPAETNPETTRREGLPENPDDTSEERPQERPNQ